MRFLEVGESMLSPRNEHHFLGAAIGGIFGTLQQSSANRANFRNTQTTNKFNMLEAQHIVTGKRRWLMNRGNIILLKL